ncbi:MAG: GNAT family N-acetyltransferase [Actinomycetota bacterium]|nr:GNAT family N-acetyltransferase [Actinomycetota bacterium]
MSFEIRKLTPEYVPAFRQAIAAGFGHDADPEDESGTERFNAIFNLDRMFPAFDGNAVVGTGGDFGFDITVPGGAQVPMSGLTIVTVRPTHTRQGVLTSMMREHFALAMDRGEPLGGLWASEAPIYGRYGYGPAVVMHDISLDARHAGRGGSEPGVTVRLLEVDEAKKLLPAVYDQIQSTRPGMYTRSAEWWTHRLFYDPKKWREGASAARHAIAELDGEPVGYVTYRQKGNWDLLSEGEIRIRELMPTTDIGYRALWHYALNIDLFPIVKYWNNPADDPVPFLVDNGRAVSVKGVSDGLWMRLIDVPAALERRTYAGSGSVVLSISDEFCGWNDGTYRLSIDGGAAECVRVTAEPDIAMTASTLGALYMGGHSAAGFDRVGLLSGEASEIRNLDSLFRHSPEPWCPEIF